MDLPTSSRNLKVVENSEWSSGLSNLRGISRLGGRSSHSQLLDYTTTRKTTVLNTKSTAIKPRKLTAKFSGYNKLKLAILLSCREEYKSLSEIMLALPGQNKKNISSKLSGLVNDFAKPYLRIRNVDRRTHLFKCTRKGLRLGCEMFRRKMLGMDLHIPRDKKKRLTRCTQEGCSKCIWNPAKGDQNEQSL